MIGTVGESTTVGKIDTIEESTTVGMIGTVGESTTVGKIDTIEESTTGTRTIEGTDMAGTRTKTTTTIHMIQ